MENTDPNRWASKAVIFLSSQTISLFGSSIVGYAIIWYITLETSSGSVMTILILCSYLPQVLISLFAGVWADRYSRKKLIIYSDLFISIATMALAVFFMSGITSLYLIYLAAAIRSIGTGIQTPAVGAILPQIVPVEKLTRVNGINSTLGSITQLLSPAVGGLLLATAGFVYTLLFDVASALAAIIIISFLKLEESKAAGAAVSTLKELRSGIKYVREHDLIKFLLLFFCLFFFLFTPALFLTPLMIERSFGGDVWRLAANELAWTIGALLGGIAVAVKGELKNRINTMTVSCLGFGITFALMGVAPNFVLYLTLMFISGTFMPFFSTAETVLIQENVEEQMLGRVFSIIQIIVSVTLPIGMLIFGPLANLVKIEYLMIGSGLLTACLALYIFSNKSIFKFAPAPAEEQQH